MPEIKLEHITKRRDKSYEVDDLDLHIDDNAFVTLLGPSGCGKTTNLFAADFVDNPSINFVDVKGSQAADGTIPVTFFAGRRVVFTPNEPLDLRGWFKTRDDKERAAAGELKKRSQQKGYVEKSNKDEPFRYRISKVEEDTSLQTEAPAVTNEDLVIGIRPEFVHITGDGNLPGEIYGAMPTGMESTIKVRVDNFLLTGVVFGSTLFQIGEKVKLDIGGNNVMLFDRKSGKRIALGSLKC